MMRATGAILGGRGRYDAAARKHDGVDGVDGIYGGAWTGPVLVLTHRLDDAPEDDRVTLLDDDVRAAVAAGLEAAGGRNLEIFGANVARQCLDAALMDEFVVHIAPLLLGDGVLLYGGAGVPRVALQRVAVSEAGQTTSLRFAVGR